MASSLEDSTPHVSDVDSPGSSVSSSLQREYEELLKYAVVTPKIQVRTNVYDQSAPVKDSVNPSTISTETKSSVSSSSSSTSTNSVITRSGESVEVSLLDAKEDVKQLPSTPSLKVSLQGQGSLARDSLLRQGTCRPKAFRLEFRTCIILYSRLCWTTVYVLWFAFDN